MPEPALACLMPPSDPRRRFARQIREAALRATPDDHDTLEALVRNVRDGSIDVFTAQDRVRTIIRAQHDRDQADAA